MDLTLIADEERRIIAIIVNSDPQDFDACLALCRFSQLAGADIWNPIAATHTSCMGTGPASSSSWHLRCHACAALGCKSLTRNAFGNR